MQRSCARRRALVVGAWIISLLTVAGCQVDLSQADRTRWANAWVDAMNSRDLGHFDKLLGAPGTYEDPLSAGRRSGPSLAMFLVLSWKRFPQCHYEIERVGGAGHPLVVEWRATGIGSASPAAPLRGVFLVEMGGNRIASVRAYFDTRLIPPVSAGAVTKPRLQRPR